MNFRGTFFALEGGRNGVNKIKRNENQEEVETRRIYMKTTESRCQSYVFKKFPFVSQYDFILLKRYCKKAEVEVLRNERIKKDYYMSFKEALGNNYIMSLQ